jgi:hypothetical protein
MTTALSRTILGGLFRLMLLVILIVIWRHSRR